MKRMKYHVIIVTGTPGTGKTTVARWISKDHCYRYVDVGALIKGKKLHEGFDRKRRCYIVPVPKLVRALKTVIALADCDLVIDSHLSHELPPSLVTACIVTTARLKSLHRRLDARKYPQKKVRENVDAEIFESCLTEARERGHEVFVVDTTGPWRKKLHSYLMTKETPDSRHVR